MKLQNKLSLSFFTFLLAAQVVFAQEQVSEKSVVLQKFGVAIGLVVFCSLLLFGILFLYKKFFLAKGEATQTVDGETFLASPKSVEEAVSVFIDKTKTDKSL